MNEGKKQGVEKFIYGRIILAKRMFGLSKTVKSCHFAIWRQRSPKISRDFKGYLKALEVLNVERNCEVVFFMVNSRRSWLTKQ